jgi:Cytochrome C oxidase, cbb3-type, subunit III
MHFVKSLGFALGMLSLSWVGGRLAIADEGTQGKALFMQYCASCHGPNGAGDGPLASSLSTPPANLRLLSLRFGNPLPQDVIARFIDGRSDVKAHGPRDMPVWGERFYVESYGQEAKVMERIARLVAFLQSIQTGARTASVTVEWADWKRARPKPGSGNRSFLTRAKGIMTGREDRANDIRRTEPGRERLYGNLNFQLRSCPFNPAIAGLRLTRNPDSLNLQCTQG